MRYAVLSAAAAAVLITGSALAADLPRRAEPPPLPPAPPLFTWTGFYAGFNAGYGFTNEQEIRTRGNNGAGAGALEAPAFTDTVANVATGRRPRTRNSEAEGFVGGGQAGYNLQLKQGDGIVVGIETDIAYTDLTKTTRFTSTLDDRSTFRQSLDFLGTLRGRIGFSYNQFLFYGTGGLAYGNVDYQARFFSNAAGQPLAYSGSHSDIALGYAAGGGIEFSLSQPSLFPVLNFGAASFKVEYLHYDLGRHGVVVDATGNAPVTGSYNSSFKTAGDVIRGGLNYRFNAF